MTDAEPKKRADIDLSRFELTARTFRFSSNLAGSSILRWVQRVTRGRIQSTRDAQRVAAAGVIAILGVWLVLLLVIAHQQHEIANPSAELIRHPQPKRTFEPPHRRRSEQPRSLPASS